MTREKSCFVFAFLMLYSQSVILILGWRPGDAVSEFLKSKPLARTGQQNRPLNMALKALLRTCVWIPSSVSEW